MSQQLWKVFALLLFLSPITCIIHHVSAYCMLEFNSDRICLKWDAIHACIAVNYTHALLSSWLLAYRPIKLIIIYLCITPKGSTIQHHNYKDRRKTHTSVYTHPFNGPFSGTTQVSRYQKGGTNLDFTEAKDSEWQRHQPGQMQVCTLLQTDNHTSIPPLSFLQVIAHNNYLVLWMWVVFIV